MKRNRSTAALVPSQAIHRRLFVVGCSRSGTALVRQLLAEHGALHSFPRTRLFQRIFGMRGRRLPWTWLGLTLGKERRLLERLAGRSTGSGAAPALPPRALSLRRSLNALLATLDRLALAAGCRNWLDTTPRHLVHARLIAQLVPRARIIHVVRDGRDVVAARCAGDADARAERNPEPGEVVAEWNRALAQHARCLGRPGHVFVLYEDLLNAPHRELAGLMYQCGIHHEPDELDAVVARVMAAQAPAGACAAQRGARLRFRERFPPHHRRRIEGALQLGRYGRLAERLRRQRANIPELPGRLDATVLSRERIAGESHEAAPATAAARAMADPNGP